MIRFIDLRHHTDDLAGSRFAFFDTVTDTFVADDMGCQVWEAIGQFAQGYKLTAAHPLERFVGLTPEWAKHAVPDREVFKVEAFPALEDRFSVGHATNEDGSAQCHMPLSPLVLGAMQGRSVAYFYGEQAYGYDGTIGAIEGAIVIDFDAEVEDQSW